MLLASLSRFLAPRARLGQLLDPLTPISPSHCHSSTSAPRCSIRGLATVRVQEKRVSGPPPSTLGCLSWSVGRPTATAERPWPKPDPLQRLRGPWVQELWSLKSGALDSIALDRGILAGPWLQSSFTFPPFPLFAAR